MSLIYETYMLHVSDDDEDDDEDNEDDKTPTSPADGTRARLRGVPGRPRRPRRLQKRLKLHPRPRQLIRLPHAALVRSRGASEAREAHGDVSQCKSMRGSH